MGTTVLFDPNDSAVARVTAYLDELDRTAKHNKFADAVHSYNDLELRRSDLRALLALVESDTEWERKVENRIHYRYGVNSGTYSAFPSGASLSHEEQRGRLERETSGPVDVTKRESRTVLYGPWVEVEHG